MRSELISWMHTYLKENIPLTQFIQLEITDFQNDRLTVSAPLLPNKNDKNTAFAGSQYSIAVLTGWIFISLKLKEQKIQHELVVSKAEIHYHKPIFSDITSSTQLLNPDDWNEFTSTLNSQRKSKITLSIHLIEHNEIKTHFTATYSAKLKNP